MNMLSFKSKGLQESQMVTNAGRKRILIVDDEPDLNALFHMVLENAGFEVQTYGDPTIALSHFEPGLFDLVVLDIKMPKMDGFELYTELKKKAVFSQLVTTKRIEQKSIRFTEICLYPRQSQLKSLSKG